MSDAQHALMIKDNELRFISETSRAEANEEHATATRGLEDRLSLCRKGLEECVDTFLNAPAVPNVHMRFFNPSQISSNVR